MDMIDRPSYQDLIATLVGQPIIKVLTGLRRSGKSTILALTAKHLASHGVAAERIIYLDFDQAKLMPINSAAKLAETIDIQMDAAGSYFVLLDEVQEVPG
ncbi:MAG: AAA family ATPase, partial [Bifidobacteriaceae bacterium]|nr:AAA family ATPase [Bifidobacteriaceae bacterium]